MKASVVLIRCSKSKRIFGARTQKMDDNDWWRTWAFPIDEGKARREGYDSETVNGNLNCTKEYPGCPYCGTKGFVQCPSCRRLSCWSGEKSMDCQWCGKHMGPINVSTKKFTVSGGDL
jgi:hypothetical protein